ncbi:amino acid adenylation domain-containing protein [Pseudomonas sp. RP23018S]|uniref:non-ribosomal peptide synthetase n=1 Tax=Pseudomonas sp. RP23018S TaxID=3096037 RepID=UPI002ACA8E74|nr:amino acid adenylation domain-containing protein [Pseudomonas sp. RP23018S]MDZ5604324.1 amino acid adenylation domain-containing protein [Pseudomonas sp. RP23018S]
MSELDVQTLGAGLALLAEQHCCNDPIARGPAAQVLDIRLHGALQVAALQAALDDLALRQPVLTTAIAAVPGYHGLRQFPGGRGAQLPLSVLDAPQPTAVASAQRQHWLRQAATQPAQVQALLQRLEGDAWHLTLVAPRVLLDASSLPLLAEQLIQTYRQGPLGADDELGQFAQYLEWRAEVVLDEDAGQAAQYWQAHLGSQALFQADLPYRRQGGAAGGADMNVGADTSTGPGIPLGATSVAMGRDAAPTGAGRDAVTGNGNGPDAHTRTGIGIGIGAGEAGVEQVEAQWSATLRQAVQALAARSGVSPDTVLQAAWWLLLARISGRSSFIAGWRHDSRADYDFFAHSLGVFEKTLPLHLVFDPQASFDTCLSQLSGVLEQHRTWQEYCPASTDATRPRCGFAARRLPALEASAWSAQMTPCLAPGLELQLQVSVAAEPATQPLSLVFDRRHYSRVAMGVLLEQYQVLLGNLVATPAAPVADCAVLGDAERERLLAFNRAAAGWNTAEMARGSVPSVDPGAELVQRDAAEQGGLPSVDPVAELAHRADAERSSVPSFDPVAGLEHRADAEQGDLSGSAAVADLTQSGAAEPGRQPALAPRAQAPAAADTLPARIAHWCRETPYAPAFVGPGETLTYAALDGRVQRLAATLAVQGVSAGTRVGLALPRSAHWLVAALATWRLGAAWVALDPHWPVARLSTLVQQADATLLISERRLELDIAHVLMGEADGQAAAAPIPEPAVLSASDLAYVLFTSGSTGMPKAVAIEHGALAHYVASASEALGLAGCQRFAFSASVVADLGHTTLFGALFNGAALHLADDATVQAGEAFARFIGEQAIDCLKIVPSHLAALLDTPQPQLPGTLVLGGEAVAPALVERLLRLRPDLRLFNHYGPSEATVGVLVHAISAADLDGSALPLTQVLGHNQLRVLDAQQQLVASGELGELYLAGPQLARGYLNAAQQQAEAFIEAPQVIGGRLYRTGDLARYRPEGGIVLQGRADQQVKLRGFRVELGEIEAELAALADVSEAAVVLDGQGEPLAFVTARGEAPDDWGNALKRQLEQRLPAVMVPRSVQPLARMPRLGNGKIDRQALTASDLGATQQAYVAPRDALEQVLAGRMAQLLGSERLSVEQDFFAAGGHSLLVIKLVAGIRKLLHCEVHPGVVFDHPSPAALAQALRLQEVAPGQLEKLAQARVRLESMSPEEKARLLEKARQPG